MMTETEQRVMDLYDKGFRSGEIAATTGMKPAAVLRIIGLYGEGDGGFSAMVVKGSRKLTTAIASVHPEKIDGHVGAGLTPEETSVRDMRLRGATIAQMARILDVPRGRIYKIMSRLPGLDDERNRLEKIRDKAHRKAIRGLISEALGAQVRS